MGVRGRGMRGRISAASTDSPYTRSIIEKIVPQYGIQD